MSQKTETKQGRKRMKGDKKPNRKKRKDNKTLSQKNGKRRIKRRRKL
jgi:hypothetical protein